MRFLYNIFMVDLSQNSVTEREPACRNKPVIDPANWNGDEISARTDWIYKLTPSDITFIEEATISVRSTVGDDLNKLIKVERSDADLGTFGQKIITIFSELKDGNGFKLIRGLPVTKWDRLDLAIAYWIIGLQLGEPVSNNPEGDLIGHVTDLGKDYENPKHRGYQTNAHMLFHCDQCDIVSLLCLQTSKTGGKSKIVSSPAVHNEMLRRRPDLVAELTAEMFWTKHGETETDEDPWYRMAVFNYFDGHLVTAGGFKHIEKGHALPGNPPLTALQKEAFAVLADINEELHFAMEFQIGDIQLLNNHVTMHSRTAYVDWSEKEKRRHLWRLWLKNPNIRPRPSAFANRTQGIKSPQTAEQIKI